MKTNVGHRARVELGRKAPSRPSRSAAVLAGVTAGLLGFVVACGDGNPPGGTGGMGGSALPEGPLMPLKVGNSWTFKVTTPNAITMKTQTVGAQEMVGAGPHSATMAFKMVTSKNDGADETISWQGVVGTKVVRFREQSFGAVTGQIELDEYWDPPKLRVDESPANKLPNAQWLEIYMETKVPANGATSMAQQRDSWKVVGIEAVTVPAQTFAASLHLQKVSGTSSNVKDYWFVPGVGKVKEEGLSGVEKEELVSYVVTP